MSAGLGVTIDLTTNRTMIEGFILQLKKYRQTTSNPEQLEWEIRLYEFMLKDPDSLLNQYMEKRYSSGTLSKQETVKLLGWVIE
jgi:hypothetical protein